MYVVLILVVYFYLLVPLISIPCIVKMYVFIAFGVKILQAQQAMKFLNITTTGVKIQQAQEPNTTNTEPNEISEYHNYWSKHTTSTGT